MAEGLAGVDFFRPLLDALACRGSGDGALGCFSGRLALAALRQHFGREIVAEHFAADVVVDGARADLRLEAPAVDLGLADGSLGAVLLVADLLDEVVGQLFQAVVLRTLLGYLADGPVCASVVRDPEARGLLIGDAAGVWIGVCVSMTGRGVTTVAVPGLSGVSAPTTT